MNESRREDILLGLFAVSVVAALVTLSLHVGGNAPRNAATYHFLMDSALGLQRDNRVTVAGVTVGVVDSLSIEGKLARVTVALEPDLILHQNARAAVRAKTLLGEKYVDLDPGEPPAPVAAPGTTLADNIPTIEIDSVIRGAAELVASLNSVTPTLKTAAARLDTVLGTADAKQFAADLTTLTRDTAEFVRTLQRALTDSSQDLRILLRDWRTRSPEILTRVETTADRVDKLLAAIPQDSLTAAIKKAPNTLDNSTLAIQDLRLAVSELRQTTAKTNKVLDNLDRVLTKANSVSEQQVRELLQVEGVRVNLITDPDIERRVRALQPPPNPPPRP
ncbi:MAG: MlaD family protein [Myxococcota bacterium]